MKSFIRILAGSLVVGFFLGGCATYTDESAQMRTAFRARHYPEALEQLKKTGLATQDRSRLLYLMETAMILDRQGNRKEARKVLLQADKLVDVLYTTSISKTAATLIVNESMSDYSGEDYEVVSLHTMLALSFLEDKQYEEARVEAKKINNRLHVIAKDRGSNNAYTEDAFARYLSGLVFEALGETDDAFIDYRRALELFETPGYKEFYYGAPPRALVESVASLAVSKGRPEVLKGLEKRYPQWVTAAKNTAPSGEMGEVAVIHETGFIAVKTTKEFAIPLAGQIIRFSVPYIEKRSAYPSSMTGVEFQGHFTQADNVADMTSLAHYSLEDKRMRLIAKNGARLLAKAIATKQAYDHLGILGGVAANVYSVVTETADTRGWTLLPEAFSVTRLRLPVGKQTIQIKNDGRINQILTVDVKRGQLQILRDCVR